LPDVVVTVSARALIGRLFEPLVSRCDQHSPRRRHFARIKKRTLWMARDRGECAGRGMRSCQSSEGCDAALRFR
jgi:hypothetical protein